MNADFLKDFVRELPTGDYLRIPQDTGFYGAASKEDRYIVGSSDAMHEVYKDISRLSMLEEPVLIIGERGTGKDTAAKVIHTSGPRFNERLIRFNLNSLSDDFFMKIFFGYYGDSLYLKAAKSAISGSENGTILLNNLSEASPLIQGALEGAIEEGRITVTGHHGINHSINSRLISASDPDLINKANSGDFRNDLVEKVAVLNLYLPPLRERRGDIGLLARYFASGEGKTISKNVIDALERYHWPGNVSELKSFMSVTAKDFPDQEIPDSYMERKLDSWSRGVLSRKFMSIEELHVSLGKRKHYSLKEAEDSFKKAFVTETLRAHNGNRTKAAKEMGIQRTYLSRLISKYGITEV